MSSLDKTAPVLIAAEDLTRFVAQVETTKRENPTDEQIKAMKLPELKLQEQLLAAKKSVEPRVRSFDEKLGDSITQNDQRTLSLVQRHIYQLSWEEKVASEINEAVLTAARDSKPLLQKLEGFFWESHTQEALLAYLKQPENKLAALWRDFAGPPFEFGLDRTPLTPEQAQILTFLPIQRLKFYYTVSRPPFSPVPENICAAIPTMQSLTSLNTHAIPYPQVLQVYKVSKKITDLDCSVRYDEKNHIRDILARMPQLEVLKLTLRSSDYFMSWSAQTEALKTATNLREITIICRWVRWEMDVSEILANLPASCKKVTIVEGKFDASNPQAIERFKDNKIEELRLYKCSSTLNNALIATKISVLKTMPD